MLNHPTAFNCRDVIVFEEASGFRVILLPKLVECMAWIKGDLVFASSSYFSETYYVDPLQLLLHFGEFFIHFIALTLKVVTLSKGNSSFLVSVGKLFWIVVLPILNLLPQTVRTLTINMVILYLFPWPSTKNLQNNFVD